MKSFYIRKNMIAGFIGIIFIIVNLTISGQVVDGSLVKGSNDLVFMIVKGKACWVSSAELFEALGLDWKNVKVIPDAQLGKIPKGLLIVKGSGNPIYILQYGVACKVNDISTFKLLGFDQNLIIPIQNDKLKKIPQEPLLIKSTGPEVYLINNDYACWVQSEKIFNALGFDMKRVFKIDSAVLQKIPKSTLILTGSNKKVYLTDKENRYWISNAALFEKLGYKWNAVLTVDDKYLNKIVEGAPIK